MTFFKFILIIIESIAVGTTSNQLILDIHATNVHFSTRASITREIFPEKWTQFPGDKDSKSPPVAMIYRRAISYTEFVAK